MKLYPKIPGPYRRHTEGPNRNQLIIGEWTSPELEMLQNVPWIFTEKIDGTNIRVGWDGHAVSFGGRTERAEIPPKLLAHLQETFTEELFEQAFGESEVVLYGEGCGKAIQKAGKLYGEDLHFVLFDVRVGNWWLLRDAIEDVAGKFGIPFAPVVIRGSLHKAIQIVEEGFASYWDGNRTPLKWDLDRFIEHPVFAEGVVGVPECGLLSRSGHRIMVKIKREDFFKG